MKKIVRIMLAVMLVVLTVSAMYVPVGAVYTEGQEFNLVDYGFGKQLYAGPFSFWTNTQIPPDGAKPLDRFEVVPDPGPVYGMKDNNVTHFAQVNGFPVAYCNANVFDYIVFTAPIDGNYSFAVNGHSWWTARDTEIGFYCKGEWLNGLILGTSAQENDYTGSFSLKKGEQIWFLFRLIMGENYDPITIDKLVVTLDKITGAQPTEYNVTVSGGKADNESSKYCENEIVTVSADTAAEGMEFEKWVAEGVTLSDETANPISFMMPAGDVKLTAQYKEIVKYTVSVTDGKLINGKTEDVYTPGSPITVTATSTNDAGQEFDHWEVEGVEVEKTDSRQLNFTMPENDVKLTAVYKGNAESSNTVSSDSVSNTDNAPTKGNDGKDTNIVLVIVLTAAISIILTALVMYLIFDSKIKALKK